MHAEAFAAWIALHGPLLVAAVVALESMGLPLPGETTLVTQRSMPARRTTSTSGGGRRGGTWRDCRRQRGYWIGRRFGHRLLVRYGPLIRIDAGRVRLGQYLFARHGGKVVFFGRFVALLRALAAVCRHQRDAVGRFLAFNAAGGVAWASIFGFGAYSLGEGFRHLQGPIAAAGVVLGIAGAAAGVWFVRRHEAALIGRRNGRRERAQGSRF